MFKSIKWDLLIEARRQRQEREHQRMLEASSRSTSRNTWKKEWNERGLSPQLILKQGEKALGFLKEKSKKAATNPLIKHVESNLQMIN